MATINVQLFTDQDQQGSKEFHVAPAVDTVAEAQAVYDAILGVWPDISMAGMDNASVTFPLTGSTPAIAGGNLDEAARLRFGMTTGVGDENYRLPSPLRVANELVYIVGGSVDIANADLLAFVALLQAGGSIRIGVNSLRTVSTLKSGYLERK